MRIYFTPLSDLISALAKAKREGNLREIPRPVDI
jgi:hypothetical protein